MTLHDAYDGDWPVTQDWLDHSLAAEPYDSRYPAYAHTHQGLDIGMPVGTGLYAVGPGTVGMVAYATLQLHLDSGVDIWMFHISTALVVSGQRITQNQRVANSGNTVPGGGASTGPHLHYEVRPGGVPYNPTNNSLDPTPWLNFGGAAAPAVGAGEFVCTITADGGAWAHSTPNLDVTSRVDLIDKGAAVVFNGWCHAGPTVAAVPDARTQATGDDRMFRSAVRGLWIASAMVLGVPGNGAPELPAVGVPPPVVIPPVVVPPVVVPPVVAPPVAFTGDVHALEGKSIWEFTDQADYAHLKSLGYSSVMIRAYNGTGGAIAQSQLATWLTRSALARAAGLVPIAWTYWYGPGEPGYTETDPAAYLLQCANATVALGLDTSAWVIDAEAHSMDGIAPALKQLRDQSGKAVFLAPPGDPVEFGFKIDWVAADAVLDGYVPQTYTGAWGSSLTIEHALSEWNSSKPLFPANDEQDPVKVAAFLAVLKAKGFKGWSYWRAGVGTDQTVIAYGDAAVVVTPPVIPPVIPPVVIPPVTPPVTPPVDPATGFWAALYAWLRFWFTGK